MKKIKGLALMCCSIYMLGSHNICAANNQTEKIQNFLDRLVVTATGSEENLFNTLADMQVLTKK